ncbi:MAG: efflux RND transporter periplasmic adaptor subunit [Coxiellaceae bacterium]|jgi:membrane fusion protein (multidrug efflux system)|nr:efflux RND transporter periplasmic adaptor subunit [Coxiellaceae bacterium]
MLRQIIIIVFFIVSFCWSDIARTASPKVAKIPPAVVETVTVQTASYPEEISSTGTLISRPGIIVKPEISGRITKIYFKSGDVVKEGTSLIEINPDIIKAQLLEAESTLKLSQLNFTRSSVLYKTHDISKADFDQAQANISSAQARVDNLKAVLRQTTVFAPFGGALGLSQVSVGDYVNAGQDIVSLQTIDPLKVDFTIPELYQSKVTLNQKVLLKTDAYPGETFNGTVEAIESLINQSNRTLSVRANVPNENPKLKSGGFVEVTLQFSTQHLIMIPQTAVIYTADGCYVFKVVNGKAEKIKVVLGIKDSDKVVIASGLKDGDIVITSGQMKVQPGIPVILAGSKKLNS